MDKKACDAYHLWASVADRPAEWWFGGSITIWPPYGFTFRTTPHQACLDGWSDQVLSVVLDNVAIMRMPY